MGKRDTIKVFLRIRPDRTVATRATTYDIAHTFENSVIKFHVDRRMVEDVVNHSREDFSFTFDRVFDQVATQEEVFDRVARECAVSVIDGYNSTVFAYGQTGSGKTYSITGGTASYNERGIIPRCISLIYEEAAKRDAFMWSINISYLQIYNDKGQDLLNRGKDARTVDDLPVVTIHETEDDIVMKGLEAHPSSSVHDALNLLFLGDTNRMYCETPMNKTSSRSHCIFTVNVEAREHGSATVRRSKLNLVDLAGSERVSRTGVVGTVLTEAKYINLSLHYLEQVIVALSEQSQGRREHIPYRNSMMTMVLRDSIGGNCRTCMLATAHPGDNQIFESLATCRFAQRVASIRQEARINEETDPHVLVRKLKQEISQLRDQVNFLSKGSQDVDRQVTGDEFDRCKDLVNRFLDNPDPNAQLSGYEGELCRVLACCRIMKEMIRNGGGASRSGTAPRTPNTPPAVTTSLAASSSGDTSALKQQVKSLQIALQQKENELSLLFSIVEKHSAAKINTAVQTAAGGYDGSVESYPVQFSTHPFASAQPSSAASQESRHAAQVQRALQMQQEDKLQEDYNLSALTDPEVLKDRTLAFEAFRKSYRKYESIERSKADLRIRYDAAKALAAKVNAMSDAVRSCKGKVQQLRAERALQGAANEGEEAGLLRQLDESKAAYLSAAEDLKKEKERIDHMHMAMQRTQDQLVKDFESWFQLRQQQVLAAGARPTSYQAPSDRPQNMDRTGSQSAFLAQQQQARREEKAEFEQKLNDVTPNPYAPQYASTGDRAADAEVARMWKAREELRARLQSTSSQGQQ